MLTVLRLTWKSVDDLQWTVVRGSLNTSALAPHGCLSWHSRRTGGAVQVSALWSHQHGVELFRERLLPEVVVAARLDPPTVTQAGVTGVYATESRPSTAAALAPSAAEAVPAWRQVA